MKINIFIVVAVVITTGCSSSQPIVSDESQGTLPSVGNVNTSVMSFGSKARMPRAVLYKTNGNFNDHVPVAYNDRTGKFISFPAPTDIFENTEPLKLADGWLLDRRGGISDDTRFLKWTYKEYSSFDQTPSIRELKDAIIKDARVTEIVLLRMTSTVAQQDTAMLNDIIRSGQLKDYIVNVAP